MAREWHILGAALLLTHFIPLLLCTHLRFFLPVVKSVHTQILGFYSLQNNNNINNIHIFSFSWVSQFKVQKAPWKVDIILGCLKWLDWRQEAPNPFCGPPLKPQGNYCPAFRPITNPLSDWTFPLGIVHFEYYPTIVVCRCSDEGRLWDQGSFKRAALLSRIYNCPDLLRPPVVYSFHLYSSEMLTWMLCLFFSLFCHIWFILSPIF